MLTTFKTFLDDTGPEAVGQSFEKHTYVYVVFVAWRVKTLGWCAEDC